MEDAQAAKAFSDGCDARIAGQPLSTNPYPTTKHNLRVYWKSGWEHVEKWWGINNIFAKPLPPVVEYAMNGESS